VDKPSKYVLKRAVLLPWEMIASTAFRELSAADVQVLLRLMQKRTFSRHKRKVIIADENLGFPYSEAINALGIARSTFRRSIRRLHERGFITVAHEGGSCQGKDYSRYNLSEDWRKYGTADFKPRQKLQTVRPGHDVRSWQRMKQATGQGTKKARSNAGANNCTGSVQNIVPVAHFEGA